LQFFNEGPDILRLHETTEQEIKRAQFGIKYLPFFLFASMHWNLRNLYALA